MIDDSHNPNISYVVVNQTVPMKWIVGWFHEPKWVHLKHYWIQRGEYLRPSLGNAFMIVYERTGNTARLLRPLNPKFPVDEDIVKRRAQGDLSR